MLGRQSPSRSHSEAAALLLLVAGAAIAAPGAAASGLAAAAAATAANGLLLEIVTRALGDKFDPLRLTFYTCAAACVGLLPFHVRLEAGAFAEYRARAGGGYLGALHLCLLLLP